MGRIAGHSVPILRRRLPRAHRVSEGLCRSQLLGEVAEDGFNDYVLASVPEEAGKGLGFAVTGPTDFVRHLAKTGGEEKEPIGVQVLGQFKTEEFLEFPMTGRKDCFAQRMHEIVRVMASVRIGAGLGPHRAYDANHIAHIGGMSSLTNQRSC